MLHWTALNRFVLIWLMLACTMLKLSKTRFSKVSNSIFKAINQLMTATITYSTQKVKYQAIKVKYLI